MGSDGRIKGYRYGGEVGCYTISVHKDDLVYMDKKLEDRFRRNVDISRIGEEIPRESLIDLEE